MSTTAMNSDPTVEGVGDPSFIDGGEQFEIAAAAVGAHAWLLTSAGAIAASKPRPRSWVDVRMVEFVMTVAGVCLFVIVVAGAIGNTLSALLAQVVHALGG